MHFDLEKTLPNHTHGDPLPEDLALAVRSTNLMSFLMGGLTYRKLYDEPLRDSMPRFIDNVRFLPKKLQAGAYDPDFDIRVPLKLVFEELFEVLSRPIYRQIRLRHLFYKRFTNPSQTPRECDAIDCFKKIKATRSGRSNDPQLKHFCMPFMAVQEGTRPSTMKPTVDPDDMEIFLEGLGEWNLQDLFTRPKCMCDERELAAIKIGKEQGLLLSTALDPIPEKENEFRVMIVNFKNKHKCIAGQCESEYPSSWCNAADDNTCSAASD